jgi:O-antigen/teichoic acid export membrane protein
MPDDSPTARPAASSDSRRSWSTGAGALLIGRLITATCSLLQVPIALAHLGPEAFGLWVALLGLVWTANILDCGFGFALQNHLVALIAHDETETPAAVVRGGVKILSLGALVILLLAVPLVAMGKWATWLQVASPGLQAQVPAAIAVVAAAAALNLPLLLASRIAASLQQMWLTGFWSAIASVIGLGAVFLAHRLNASLAGFTLAGCVLPLLPGVGIWLTLWRRERWLFGKNRARPDWRNLRRESGLFFLPQLGAAFVGAFVPTLVAVFATPLAVASYSVLQRIFGLALQLQGLALLPTWPAYTRAGSMKDAALVRRTYRSSWTITALVFAVPTVLLTPIVPAVVHLWLGSHAPEIPKLLLWAVAGWHVVQYLGQPPAMLLNGLNRQGSLGVLVWVGIGGTLALSTIFGPRWGAVGVLLALALPYVLVNLPVVTWKARQAIGSIGSGGPTEKIGVLDSPRSVSEP